MILKAEIQERIDNKYQIRIPTFEAAGSTKQFITKATVAIDPGTEYCFMPGDIVFIAFENNDIDKPVIIGELLTNKSKEATGAKTLHNLTVEGQTQLSKDIKIGDISYDDLLAAVLLGRIQDNQMADIYKKVAEIIAGSVTIDLPIANDADIEELYEE